MAVGTRKEQRERTREQLLDATVTCLVQYGFAGTTTQRIQDEVGVSRGALLHHFESKHELFVAAIRHIAKKRLVHLRTIAAELESHPDPMRKMVLGIRELMSGAPFQAALELWAAARTDSILRRALLPAERRLGAAIREVFDRYSGITDPVAARVDFESLMALVRGLELTRIMRPDAGVIERVIDHWVDGLARRRQESASFAAATRRGRSARARIPSAGGR